MRLTKLFSAILAAVLVLAGVSVAQSPSAQAAGKTYITISASPTVRTLAQSTTITTKYYKSGKLQKSGTLYLQYKSGSKWVNVRTLKISSTGTTKTKVKPTVNRTYRIATAKNKVVSPTVSVKLKSGFTITLSKSSADKGATVKFTASNFSKGKPRTGKVQLQYYKNGKWSTLKTLTLKNGTASYSRAATTTMKWRFRYPTTGAVTKSVTLKVKPKLTLTASASTLTSGKSATLTVGLQRDGKSVASEKVTLQSNTGAGWGTLKSLTVTSGKASTSVSPTTTTSYRILTSDKLTSATKKIAVTTISASRYWVDSTGSSLNMRSDAGTGYAIVSKLANTSRVTATSAATKTVGTTVWRQVSDLFGNTGWVSTDYLTKTEPAKSFVFQGSGFGHGVGMSQYGAYAMGLEGKSASEILKTYYSNSAVSQVSTPEDIAVRINGASQSSTTFSIDSGKMRVRNQVDTATIDKADGLTNAYTIKLSANSAGNVVLKVMKKSDGSTVTSTTAPGFQLQWSGTDAYLPSGTDSIVTLSGSGNEYRHGYIRVSTYGGKLNVVNVLNLNDEYLYGLSEMSSSWGMSAPETLKAQAIAGRSYALSKMGSLKTSCDCHVQDSIVDQVFAGWTKENGASSKYWLAAVNSTFTSTTKGTVVTYNGSVANALYFSYSGGKTANAKDVWNNGSSSGSNVPYEVSVSDPWSAKAPGVPGTWQHVVTEAQLLKIFTNLTNISSLRIDNDKEYKSGQAWGITATDAAGKEQTVYRSDSGTSSVSGWRTLLKGWNNKISVSGITSAPASWILDIQAN